MASFMQRLQHSRIYPQTLRALRVLQLISALVSIIIFSLRIRKLLKLYSEFNRATGAVEGILAAAILYTILATSVTFLLKGLGGSILRWFLVALDAAFVGAFIAVAVFTSPKNGSGGLGCYGGRKGIASQNNYVNDPYCQLPLGTFITAIASTILHALTAIFHSIHDNHRRHSQSKPMNDKIYNGEAYENNDPIDGSHYIDTNNRAQTGVVLSSTNAQHKTPHMKHNNSGDAV